MLTPSTPYLPGHHLGQQGRRPPNITAPTAPLVSSLGSSPSSSPRKGVDRPLLPSPSESEGEGSGLLPEVRPIRSHWRPPSGAGPRLPL